MAPPKGQTVDIKYVVLMVTFYNWTLTYLKLSVIYQHEEKVPL